MLAALAGGAGDLLLFKEGKECGGKLVVAVSEPIEGDKADVIFGCGRRKLDGVKGLVLGKGARKVGMVVPGKRHGDVQLVFEKHVGFLEKFALGAIPSDEDRIVQMRFGLKALPLAVGFGDGVKGSGPCVESGGG